MFKDPWSPRPFTFKVISPNVPCLANIKVVEFITPSVQWDEAKLQQYLLGEDVELIKSLPISMNAPDRWIWHYDSRGEYYVKSGYKLGMFRPLEASMSTSGMEARWWKKVWKLRIPNKVKILCGNRSTILFHLCSI